MSVSKNVSCECGLNDRKRGGVVNVKHKAVKFILATEKKKLLRNYFTIRKKT